MIQIGIIISLVVAIIFGAIASKKVKGKTRNYYVAGRNLSALMVGFALVSQAIDGNATMVNTDLSYSFGFWGGAVMIIGLALSILLLGIFFAPKLNSLRLLTLADFFGYKYNRKIEVIASIIMLFSFGLLLAGNIAGVALLIQMFWSISYNSIVLIICLVVVIYCIGGGIISDIYSDLWQAFIVVLSIISALIFLIYQFDFSGLWHSEIIANFFSLSQLTANSSGALINWSTIVALGFGNILAVDFCSRYLSAKSPKAARKGCYIGACLTMLIGIPFSFLPILFQWLNIAPLENTPIIIAFGSQVFPTFIYTILVCGIISAALSTIDGAVLSMSNIFAHNLLNIQKNIDPDNERETEKTYLYFSRLSLLPIICLAMIFAMLLPAPGSLITIAFDVMFCGLLIPFIFAFYTNHPNPAAALWAIIIGSSVRAFFAVLTPTAFGVPNQFLYISNNWFPPASDGLGTIVSPIIALIIYVIISLIKKNPNEMKQENNININLQKII